MIYIMQYQLGGKQGPYEFEGEWRGVHGRIWRQEREGRL